MTANVTSGVFAQQPAWHGVGPTLAYAPTSAEARPISGLDWEPFEAEMYLESGKLVPKHKAILRSDDARVIGVVSNNYEPIANVTMFEFLDSLVAEGDAVYESAGCLKHGEKVWALIRMPESDIVREGDTLDRFVLAAMGHDGSMAFTTTATSVRVVCQNTLSQALSASTSTLRVRHTKGAKAAMEEARKVMIAANDTLSRMAARARQLDKIDVVSAEASGFFSRFLDRVILKTEAERKQAKPVSGADILGDVLDQHESKDLPQADRHAVLLADIVDRFDRDIAAGTAWGAFNAVTEWVDHGRKFRNQDNRFNSIMLGDGNRQKATALDMAIKSFVSV